MGIPFAARLSTGGPMLLVRDIMHCKPGKVRPMVEKCLEMKRLGEGSGMGSMRILTDLAGERFWTVVIEMEVPSMEAYMQMDQDPAATKEMEKLMKDYHELVDQGRREIYTIEG
jgi:hypothetical protein